MVLGCGLLQHLALEIKPEAIAHAAILIVEDAPAESLLQHRPQHRQGRWQAAQLGFAGGFKLGQEVLERGADVVRLHG